MNARLAALITALETLVVVGIGVGIFFAPLSLVWAIDDGFSTDLLVYWRTAADFWLLGHGVPVSVTVDAETAFGLGLSETQTSFLLSAAPLGPAVLTFWWGFRMGRRDLVLDFPLVVWLVGIGTMLALSFGIHLSAFHPVASTELLDALVRPSLFLAAGLVIASWTTKWSQGRQWLQSVLSGSAWELLSAGFRAGVASLAVLLGAASVFLFFALVFSYSTVIALFESLGPTVLGLVVLFIGQMAFVPNLVIWTAAWLVGPGFYLGTGAYFSALGAQVQAVPAVPLLGALPDSAEGVGFSLIVIPVAGALVSGFLTETRLAHVAQLFGQSNLGLATKQVLRIGIVGLIGTSTSLAGLSLLGALASGALGPGRYEQVGVDVGQFALWWGIEVGVGIALGMLMAIVVRWIRQQEQTSAGKSPR